MFEDYRIGLLDPVPDALPTERHADLARNRARYGCGLFRRRIIQNVLPDFVIWTYELPRGIEFDEGRRIKTLAEARDVVLSAMDFRAKPYWQMASQSLLTAAQTGKAADLQRAYMDMVAGIEAERAAAQPLEDEPLEGEGAPSKAPTKADRARRWVERGRSVRKTRPDADGS